MTTAFGGLKSKKKKFENWFENDTIIIGLSYKYVHLWKRCYECLYYVFSSVYRYAQVLEECICVHYAIVSMPVQGRRQECLQTDWGVLLLNVIMNIAVVLLLWHLRAGWAELICI